MNRPRLVRAASPRMRWGRLSNLLVALPTCVIAAAACTQAPATTPTPKPRATLDGRPAFDSPARWSLHPEWTGVASATLELEQGRCLVASDTGDRWLVERIQSGGGYRDSCSGPARASGQAALTSIVAIQRVGERLRFVGLGGVIYEADDPLGPFVRATRPPRHLSMVAAGDDQVLGLDESGGTWFYGDSWRESAVPEGAKGYSLAVGRDRRALWLGLPERILGSTDGGKSFQPIGAVAHSTIGAQQPGTTSDGDLAVRGMLGTLVWRGDRLEPSAEKLPEPEALELDLEPEPGPRASAVRDRRAAMAGRRYVELRKSEDASDETWTLREGEIGGTLRDRELRELDCESAIVGAAGSVTIVACMREEPESESLSVELLELGPSAPTGGSTGAATVLAKLRAETFLDVELAVSNAGEVLVTGVCGAHDQAEPKRPDDDAERPSSRARLRKIARDERACDVTAPVWVKREGTETVVLRGRAKESAGSARSPTVSPDGKRLYFLGRYGPDQLAGVFVSRDGGRSYQARPLAAPYPTRSELDDDWEEGAVESVRQLDLEPVDEAPLSIDEGGMLGLPVSDGMGMAWASIAPDGRVAEVHRPPLSSGVLAGHGSRVFVAGYDDREGSLQAFESSDGGLSFSEIPASPSLSAAIDSAVGFACGAAGCLLGDQLARVGWDGQLEAALSLSEDIPPVFAPRLGELVACEPTKAEPVEFAGLGDDRDQAPRLPRLDELGRGELAWSSVAIDPATGHIDVVSAVRPSAGAAAALPTRKPLLPGRAPARGALPPYVVRPQAEGFVALRATSAAQPSAAQPSAARPSATPARAAQTPSSPQSYELAWTNELTGVAGRRNVQLDRTIADRASVLAPAMLQIAMGGVALRATETAPMSFVDSRSVTPVDYPAFQSLLDVRASLLSPELAILGGQPWGLLVSRPPTANEPVVVALAKAGGGAATALAVGRPSSELGWLHTTDRIGVAVRTPAAREGDDATAIGVWIEPGGSLGAPFDLPSLSDALEAYRPCSREEARTSPRLVAPHFTQSGVMLAQRGRRAVVVSDPSPSSALAGDTWLLSDGAVMHLAPSGPCVAAMSAASVRPGALVVLDGDGRSGWLLEHTAAAVASAAPARAEARPRTAVASRPGQVLRVRALSCRLRNDLFVPPDVEARAGDPLLRGRR